MERGREEILYEIGLIVSEITEEKFSSDDINEGQGLFGEDGLGLDLETVLEFWHLVQAKFSVSFDEGSAFYASKTVGEVVDHVQEMLKSLEC